MSDVHENSNNVNEVVPETEKEEFVEKKLYKKSLDDMHASKAAQKELKARLDAVTAEVEAKEKASLYEQEKWKELYQSTDKKLTKVLTEQETDRSKLVEVHKKNAVVEQLGGFKKPEYVKFVNMSAVEMDDSGNISPESIAAEVQRLRKEYPELIKASDVKPLPSGTFRNTTREYNDLSQKEKLQFKLELANKK